MFFHFCKFALALLVIFLKISFESAVAIVKILAFVCSHGSLDEPSEAFPGFLEDEECDGSSHPSFGRTSVGTYESMMSTDGHSVGRTSGARYRE